MLVLSRRENEKLVFSNLGVTIEIVKIAGRSVRVGIEAPREVHVLRHELADSPKPITASNMFANLPKAPSHRLRNQLNKLRLGLHVIQRQNETGMNSEADATLQKVLTEFQVLDDELAPCDQPSSNSDTPSALIVEDDKNESELLAGFLRMSGYYVEVASDGCDALDYLATHGQPHIVLLDMQMPRCDGPTTLSAIRQHPDYRDVSVFGVSGRKPHELGINVGPNGVDRWFTKPVNPESLVFAMNRHLEKESANS